MLVIIWRPIYNKYPHIWLGIYKIHTNDFQVGILLSEIDRQNMDIFLYECTDTSTSLTVTIFPRIVNIIFLLLSLCLAKIVSTAIEIHHFRRFGC